MWSPFKSSWGSTKSHQFVNCSGSIEWFNHIFLVRKSGYDVSRCSGKSMKFSTTFVLLVFCMMHIEMVQSWSISHVALFQGTLEFHYRFCTVCTTFGKIVQNISFVKIICRLRGVITQPLHVSLTCQKMKEHIISIDASIHLSSKPLKPFVVDSLQSPSKP